MLPFRTKGQGLCMAGIVATLPSIPKITRMLRRSCIAMLLKAIAVEADGLFTAEPITRYRGGRQFIADIAPKLSWP